MEVLQSLKKTKGKTFTELTDDVVKIIRKKMPGFKKSIPWYTISVRLDLETKGIVETYIEKGKKLNLECLEIAKSLNNIELQIKKHNSGKGAKSTRGYLWIVIYKKKFKDKNKAMSYEYKLKKDYKLRKNIKSKTKK